MPTITINGSRRSFTDPRQLMQEAPFGPPQPIAEWPEPLRIFTAMIAAGDYLRAMQTLRDHHVSATTADVDPGSLAAFQAYVTTNASQTISGSFLTGSGWW